MLPLTKNPKLRKRGIGMYYAFALVVCLVAANIVLIQKMSATGKNNVTSAHDAAVVAVHRNYGYMILLLTLFQIGLVEFTVKRLMHVRTHDGWFWLHMGLVAMVTVGLILLFVYRGNSHPVGHRRAWLLYSYSYYGLAAVGTFMFWLRATSFNHQV